MIIGKVLPEKFQRKTCLFTLDRNPFIFKNSQKPIYTDFGSPISFLGKFSLPEHSAFQDDAVGVVGGSSPGSGRGASKPARFVISDQFVSPRRGWGVTFGHFFLDLFLIF